MLLVSALKLVSPKPLEPAFGQRGVARRRLQISVPKVVRQAPGVMPIIRELISRRVPQHVRMHRERQLRRSASSLHHSQEPSRCRWRACKFADNSDPLRGIFASNSGSDAISMMFTAAQVAPINLA